MQEADRERRAGRAGVAGVAVRLHAVGGLCNRLRAILSYRDVYGSLEVVWEPDEYVSRGRWADVFEPLPGLSFRDDGAWDAEDFAPHKDAPNGWQGAYGELYPVHAVRTRIRGFTGEDMPPYIACHVRRTDHVPDVGTHGGNMTRLSEFLDWAQGWDGPIYVATDNGETQIKLRNAWPDRFLCGAALDGAEEQALTNHARNGVLADAVVDLFVCARARRFKGSRASSFSETIEILRELRR